MNAYLDVIMNALLVFPLMAVIFTLPYIIYNYRKYGSVFSMRILIVYSFVLYLLCAVPDDAGKEQIGRAHV